MVTMIDPTEYIETALKDAGSDPVLLRAVSEGLDRIGHENDDELMLMIVTTDDLQERVTLMEHSLYLAEQLAEAHTRLELHLRTVAGLVPDVDDQAGL